MDYFDAVANQTRGNIDQMVNDFLDDADPDKRTVVMLPGGMGSRLRRAWPAYDPASPSNPAFYSTIWLDCGVIWAQDALKLTIDEDGFDLDQRIVIADREVDFFVDPYDRAIHVFRNWNFNVLVLGWDWRRQLMKGVAALEYLLTKLRDGAQSKWNRAILGKTFVVGHSMGGIVTKLFMSHHAPLTAECGGMITVGTPFYGYFGQLKRCYYGDEMFNPLYGALQAAHVVTSLPGLYTLLPIDLVTWQSSGADIGLAQYPVTDHDTGDPFDPYGAAAELRYPAWVRGSEVMRALQVRYDLAAPLPMTIADKLFHLRSDMANSTDVSAVWSGNVGPDYVPGATQPIVFTAGDGDNTIPYWSARLASTPDANVTDFDHGEHMFLMEDDDVLIRIREIILASAVAETGVGGAEPPITGSEVDTGDLAESEPTQVSTSKDRHYFKATQEERKALEKLVGPKPELADKEEAIALIQTIKRGGLKPGQVYDKRRGDQLVPPPIVRRLIQESGF